MPTVRSLTIALVVLAIVASGCSSSGNDDVAALEERIAELEAASSSTTLTVLLTTTTLPTTTTQPPTTTTTQPPTTTTTVPTFDLAAFNFDSLVSWMEAESTDPMFGRFAISSCENSVESLGKLAQVYRQELVLTVGMLIEVRDGNASLNEVDARFSRLKSVFPYAAAPALAAAKRPEIGRATNYASLVSDAIHGSLLSIISFPIVVYDVENGKIDWDAFEIWGGSLVTAIEELENLGARSWTDYCS